MTRIQGTIKVCDVCKSNYMAFQGVRSGGCPVCAENNPPVTDRDKTSAGVREFGRDRSLAIRCDTSWSYRPQLLWRVAFAVPFAVASVSKNRSHILSTRTRYDEHGRPKVIPIRVPSGVNERTQGAIAGGAQAALLEKGVKVVQARLWVDILVQKTDLRSDAANVVDTVFDGLKLGVGLDDNWFSIRILDWEVVKDDPQIIIGIGQETEVEHNTCLACGAIVPSATLKRVRGIARVCAVCTRGA